MESIRIIESSQISLKMIVEESSHISVVLKDSIDTINIVTQPTVINLKVIEENTDFRIKTISIPGPQGPPGNSANLFESSQAQICIGSSTINYNIDGSIESIEYDSGITKSFTYDNSNKLTEVSITNGIYTINKIILYDINDNIIGYQINEL